MTRPRLLVVVGATGVGKSRLGIELARALNGEVVNADAMQLYKGLDIASAKVTKEECQGVPHHLLGVLDTAETWTVRDYRDKALAVIDDVARRNRLPVVVGGTLYYIQSLLWPSLVDETAQSTRSNSSVRNTDVEYSYTKLQELDPKMAEMIHPKDSRKIKRSIDVFHETGQRHSEILAQQREQSIDTKLRFNCLVFWMTCEKTVHDERLRKRIDSMLSKGLLDEAEAFIESLDPDADLDTGIFQTIGYKEFLPYFKSNRDESKLVESVEALFVHHRQYSNSQLKWIRNRLLPRNAPVLKLDATEIDSWKENVFEPALKISKDFLQSEDWDPKRYRLPENVTHANTNTPLHPSSGGAGSTNANKRKRFVCDSCGGMVIIGEKSWALHVQSRKHRRRLQSTRETDQNKRTRRNE